VQITKTSTTITSYVNVGNLYATDINGVLYGSDGSLF